MTSLKLSNSEGWNTQTKFQNELLVEQKLTDVTLACDDGFQIGVHRTIISASSLFFREVIMASSNQNPFIYLRGVKQETLKSLLNFIYVGETIVKTENVDDLVLIGNELKITGIMEMEVQDGTSRIEETEESDKLETPLNLTKEMKYEQDSNEAGIHSSNLALEVENTVPEKKESKPRQTKTNSVDTWKGPDLFPLIPVDPNSKEFNFIIARPYLKKLLNILGYGKGCFKKYGEKNHKPVGWPEEVAWTKNPIRSKTSEIKIICKSLFKVHMKDVNFDTYYEGAGGWKWTPGDNSCTS